MEWNNKIKMVQLGNEMHTSEETKNEFKKFVIDNIETFDEQAWDMFSNLIDLIELEKDVEFCRAIYSYLKNVNLNSDSFGFRVGMRLSLMQVYCEKYLTN